MPGIEPRSDSCRAHALCTVLLFLLLRIKLFSINYAYCLSRYPGFVTRDRSGTLKFKPPKDHLFFQLEFSYVVFF